MSNNYDNFSDFIENIMFNKNNHHLVFDENNILKRINCLYGVDDEIATITVGQQYLLKNNIPEPYYNYIFNNNEPYHIFLDNKQYVLLNTIGETIDNIYSFNDINKNNFDEILNNIKYSYLKDIIDIKIEDKQYCWELFEHYAKEYYKIIDVNEPIFCNKYDEDYHYENIYDKIYDLQKKHKNNIINKIVDDYRDK